MEFNWPQVPKKTAKQQELDEKLLLVKQVIACTRINEKMNMSQLHSTYMGGTSHWNMPEMGYKITACSEVHDACDNLIKKFAESLKKEVKN